MTSKGSARTRQVYDPDDEALRQHFFDVEAMKKLELVCPRCGAELLVVNSRASMIEHDKNAGVYCFARPPVCYVNMLALRPGFQPT